MEEDMIFDQAKQLVAGMSENPELLTTPIGEKSESVEFPEKICRGLSANEVECVLLEQGVLFWDKRKKIDGIYEPNESSSSDSVSSISLSRLEHLFVMSPLANFLNSSHLDF